MLLELHVKNLALIEQADVELGEGLNILTGETGAGKSILIDSVSLALGRKASKEMIRSDAEYAYVELVFSVEEEQRAKLEALEVFPDEEGLLVISRRIMPNRSVSRINDETVTAARLRAVTGLLIDIHGQHEHQSLLHIARHLEILDIYAKSRVDGYKNKISELYKQYRGLKDALAKLSDDAESRRRETDFLRFELNEIENAALKNGEEETLAAALARLESGRQILAAISAVYEAADSSAVSCALGEVGTVAGLDESVAAIRDQLYDAEAVLNDIRHAARAYLDETEFDEEEMARIRERLDAIRSMEAKYGATVEAVQSAYEKKRQRLDELEHFDERRAKLEEECGQVRGCLEKLCGQLSQARREAAGELADHIREALVDLNFLDVRFSMEFRRLTQIGPEGWDEAEFMISTNPGEPLRPLAAVASGGELSRIMLAIKTVLADSDAVPTLIFDEIDSGISGRTAQKVSEKLAIISRNHQVICITHLPQIAAMADCHYEIAKSVSQGKTATRIRALNETEMTDELARLLGGAEITDAVRQNAREMKKLAAEKKEKQLS